MGGLFFIHASSGTGERIRRSPVGALTEATSPVLPFTDLKDVLISEENKAKQLRPVALIIPLTSRRSCTSCTCTYRASYNILTSRRRREVKKGVCLKGDRTAGEEEDEDQQGRREGEQESGSVFA